MSGRPTSRSIRMTKTYHGIAYGARALWRRSAHSNRRSCDLPRRPGKPDHTGEGAQVIAMVRRGGLRNAGD